MNKHTHILHMVDGEPRPASTIQQAATARYLELVASGALKSPATWCGPLTTAEERRQDSRARLCDRHDQLLDAKKQRDGRGARELDTSERLAGKKIATWKVNPSVKRGRKHGSKNKPKAKDAPMTPEALADYINSLSGGCE